MTSYDNILRLISVKNDLVSNFSHVFMKVEQANRTRVITMMIITELIQ